MIVPLFDERFTLENLVAERQEQQQKERKRRRIALAQTISWFSFSALLIAVNIFPKPSFFSHASAERPVFTFTDASYGTARTVGAVDESSSPVTVEERKVFDAAREAWVLALPAVKGQPVNLAAARFGPGEISCGMRAIACADQATRTVYLQRRGFPNLKAILLHELAHLYGVPHVAGDPLMDPANQGHDLQKPSDLAVLIAKYRMAHPRWPEPEFSGEF